MVSVMRYQITVSDTELLTMTPRQCAEVDDFIVQTGGELHHAQKFEFYETVYRTTNRTIATVLTAVARGGYAEARKVMDMLVASGHGT